MKECIGSIVSSQADLHKYNHPKEFEEHFLYPGNLYRLNDTDKKKYYEYIREYYSINRIYMPDFSDAEIYKFFLKAETAEIKSRRNRVKAVFNFSRKFTAEMNDMTASNKQKNELLNEKGSIISTMGSGIGAIVTSTELDKRKLLDHFRTESS